MLFMLNKSGVSLYFSICDNPNAVYGYDILISNTIFEERDVIKDPEVFVHLRPKWKSILKALITNYNQYISYEDMFKQYLKDENAGNYDSLRQDAKEDGVASILPVLGEIKGAINERFNYKLSTQDIFMLCRPHKTRKLNVNRIDTNKETIENENVKPDDVSVNHEAERKRDRYYNLKTYLSGILISTRDSHPSFVLMKKDELDERLFPRPVISDGIEASEVTKEHQIRELPSLGRTESGGKSSPVWEIIKETWDSDKKRNVVITGAGGIGKTVTLFSITRAPDGTIPVPAVYIPVYDLIRENECLDLSAYFMTKDREYGAEIGKLASEVWEMQPSLLVLLDGFNEIPASVRRKALSAVNGWYTAHPGVQIIAVSRPMDGLDLAEELYGEPIKITLSELEDKVISQYLKSAAREIPAEDDPVWNVLRYPLFLNLYVKTSGLKGNKPAGYPLDIREPKNAGSLIWNFLQRELLRKSFGSIDNNESWVLQCAFTCEYILPYIAYNMFINSQITIPNDELVRLTDCALDSFDPEKLPRHLDEIQAKYMDEHDFDPFLLSSVDKKQWRSMVRRDVGLLVSLGGSGMKTGKQTDCAFVHQVFRDSLAALHLVNLAQEYEALPGEWKKSIRPELLDYVAELISEETAAIMWERNRIYKQHRENGSAGNSSTYNMLELNARLKTPGDYLNFSGMDLRGMSLINYMGRGKYDLGLFRRPELSKDTYIDRGVFENPTPERFAEIIKVLKDGRIAGGTQSIQIWDPNTGECLLRFNERSAFHISCLAELRDGRIISGWNDGSLSIWDAETGECQLTLEGHSENVDCIAENNDGRIISCGVCHSRRSSVWSICVWDIKTGECLYAKRGNDGDFIFSLSALNDGRIVCCFTCGDIFIMDINSMKGFSLEGHSKRVRGIAELDDGRLISSSDDGTVRIWNLETRECQFTLEEDAYRFAVLRDRRIVCTNDQNLCIWDIDTGECQCTFEQVIDVTGMIKVLKDGRIVCTHGPNLCIWDLDIGECQRTIEYTELGDSLLGYSLSELADGRIVYAYQGDHSHDVIRIFSAETGKCQLTIEGRHPDDYRCLAELRDGRIAGGLACGTILIWNPYTGECPLTLEGHTKVVSDLVVLKNGRLASGDGSIRIWDTYTGECLYVDDIQAPISCFTVLEDGTIIFSQRDTIYIDKADKDEYLVLNGHDSITDIAKLIDGRIVSCSINGTLRIWDIDTGECQLTLKEPSGWVNGLEVLNDGRIISGATDGSIRVWDAETGECQLTINAHSWITDLVKLNDGRLASGATDSSIRVWDIETGECQRTLEGHSDRVICLAVLNDGRLASGAIDGSIRIWDVETGECIDVLERTEIDVSAMNFQFAVLDDSAARLLSHNRATISSSVKYKNKAI